MAGQAPRVLHVSLAKGWRGGEQQTWLLMQALAERGFQQGLCARPEEPLAQAAGSLPGMVVFSHRQGFWMPRQVENFDVAHAHEARGAYLTWWLRQTVKLPYIVTRRMEQSPRARFLTKRAYGGAEYLVGISSAACEGLEKLVSHPDVKRVPSAHSGALPDPARAREIRHWLLNDPSATLIGHAGALVDAHKGQSVLIEAVKEIRRAGHNIEVVFFGEGRDRSELQALSVDCPWIHWPGQVHPIQNYLGALDLFAFPSRHEGLGSVLIDVLLAGVPVVASKVGGIPDLIDHNETGLLIEPNHSGAMASALLQLLSDPALTKRLSEAGHIAAAQFSAGAMANAYRELYASVLHQ